MQSPSVHIHENLFIACLFNLFELTELKGKRVSEETRKIGLKGIYFLELGQFSHVKIAVFITCGSDFIYLFIYSLFISFAPGQFLWI